MPWKFYGDPLYRYRDEDTGRFASAETVRAWGEISMDSSAAETRPLASDLADGGINLQTWQAEMRARIKAEYVRQYFLGIGGREQMTQADWGSVGGLLAKSYSFLDTMAAQIAAGELSETQIGSRSEMYILSARNAYERANARTRGIPILSQNPADGQQICLSRCRCFWDHRRRGNTWESTWTLTEAEHCETCLANSARWNPLVTPMDIG